ncbi:MAG: nuclear transport factor 2 family protein [Ardenticatenaceae bacterium]|nr:nuclear transport factor 2 family protein [Anaerolineales bacterium]MCB8923258.1 nuclear transport factor 2 family protein [Ardenticatenaceae bacterium]
MASILDNYFAALTAIDRDAYVACFAEDAVVLDPYGGRPFQGTTGLHKFMDGMERTWDSFQMTPGESYAAGDRTAVSWHCTATAKSGKIANFAGIDVFTLTEDGLISQLEGYWDFKAMLAQIS